MRIRSLRKLTQTSARPWVLVAAGGAITAVATLSPVVQHAASAASGGIVVGNHSELLGLEARKEI